MIIALGTEFSADTSHGPPRPLLYERTKSLVPELIHRSDIEIVRGCLDITAFLFPKDHSGGAYTDSGLAPHIAIRNHMQKQAYDEVEVRIW
jgi:hypothetical protein